MSDVRLLPRLAARPTGIPRASTQVPQRQPTDTTTSHVSASPAAGAQAQAQVRAASRPPGMRQDTRVQILDRRSAAPAAPASTGADSASAGIHGPTVQLVERPRASGPADAASPFTIEQMMLIGHLLDRYLENTQAIQDTANAALAEGALIVLAGLLPAPAPPPAQDSAPLVVPTPAVAVAAPAAPPSPTVPIAESDDASVARRSRRRPRGRGAGGDASAPSEGSTPASPPSSPEGPSSASEGEPSTPAAPSAAPEKM